MPSRHITRLFVDWGGGFSGEGEERKDVPAKQQSFFHIFEFRALFDVGIHKYPPKNGSGHTPTNLSTAHIIAAKLQ
jgi:hypothetical protein